MRLQEKVDAGTFVVIAEIDPPKGADVSTMINHANSVKGDVDALLVPEMSNAVMRMSALGGAMLLGRLGIDTVMQVNCRDRNRLALQADLLAANACGVDGVMAVTGEDPSFGDHHETVAVNDIDLMGLLGGIRQLQSGRDMAGIELAGAPSFFTGSSLKLPAQADDADVAMADMEAKIEAGVQFLITTPVFDPSVLAPFQERCRAEGIALIPTVVLLKSVGMARYMARNVPHITISDDLITRIQKSPDKPEACTSLAAELIVAIRDAGLPGAVISTIGWEGRLPAIVQKIR